MTTLAELGDSLASAAGRVLASSGYRAEVKTNLGPAVTLYDSTSSGPSLADALGIKAALVIRDGAGNVVTSYGDPPATNPVLVAALAGAAAVVLIGLVVLIRRL